MTAPRALSTTMAHYDRRLGFRPTSDPWHPALLSSIVLWRARARKTLPRGGRRASVADDPTPWRHTPFARGAIRPLSVTAESHPWPEAPPGSCSPATLCWKSPQLSTNNHGDSHSVLLPFPKTMPSTSIHSQPRERLLFLSTAVGKLCAASLQEPHTAAASPCLALPCPALPCPALPSVDSEGARTPESTDDTDTHTHTQLTIAANTQTHTHSRLALGYSPQCVRRTAGFSPRIPSNVCAHTDTHTQTHTHPHTHRQTHTHTHTPRLMNDSPLPTRGGRNGAQRQTVKR